MKKIERTIYESNRSDEMLTLEHNVSKESGGHNSTIAHGGVEPKLSDAQRKEPNNLTDRAIGRHIKDRRIVFHCLPVAGHNDLHHGSWWYLIGSLLASLIPIVVIVNLFDPFWDTNTSLPLLTNIIINILLIASGVLFTLGSLAFLRASREPTPKPLLASLSALHIFTDDQLASWFFLLGAIVYPAIMAIYLYYNIHSLFYWRWFLASMLFVLATIFFVLSTYSISQDQDQDQSSQLSPRIAAYVFGKDSSMLKHFSSDWLASTWIFFAATLVMTLECLWMFVLAVKDGNSLNIYLWSTS